MHVRIEELPFRLDIFNAVLGQNTQKLSLHKLNTLQQTLEVPVLISLNVHDCSFQVIDRSQEILDEILVAVLEGLLLLFKATSPEIVEFRLKSKMLLRLFFGFFSGCWCSSPSFSLTVAERFGMLMFRLFIII